ncbi:hypothetical protein EHQ58_08725 [Leptospira ognonensis]|uniref:Transmembrane family 220, helix n=1 Tax=Leptospira ognonensis TaxID=2484945 RepID=A0A4R9K353_9LEPT|nr:transmembrane 220 family protein [Leptospira ognonensis]TGL59320.1 hypothetical protein EHQ58_08725 [Leptospira ognonensis]
MKLFLSIKFWIRCGTAILAALLLFSALVQYNDPDPLHWMFLYGLGAFLCASASFGKYHPNLIFICIGACLLQLMIVFDGTVQWYFQGVENILSTPMSKEKPYIEEVREFFGVMIVFVSMIWLSFLSKRQK